MNKHMKSEFPLDVVVVDHMVMDVPVTDDVTSQIIGRPYLTSLIDGYSGCILGFYIGFDAPSSLSVMFALKNAINKKGYVKEKYPNIKQEWNTYGVPKQLIIDNVKEFVDKHLDDVCDMLGIEVVYRKATAPSIKGRIERCINSANSRHIHQLLGTTFSGMEKSNYNLGKRESVTLEELKEIVHTWIIDVYNVKAQRGINAIPILQWREGIKLNPPRMTVNRGWEQLVGKRAVGIIQRAGIRMRYYLYNSEELRNLRRLLMADGKSPKVKYMWDPENIGLIRVFNPYQSKFIEVPCSDIEAHGMSVYTRDILIKEMEYKARVYEVDRMEAKQRYFETMMEEIINTRKRALDF